MANKKTTLKTQTGDNVYPNVLKKFTIGGGGAGGAAAY